MTTIDDRGSAASEAFPGWPHVLGRLLAGEDIGALAGTTLEEILGGRAEPAQIAAFAAALRTKGETVDELASCVVAMRRAGERIDLDVDAIDTCGTGGDRSSTINVSTTAAFIAAGAGAIVAKHGGRAASSVSGSADVLEALGVVIDLGPQEVARCIDEVGIGFCFAPRFHPAMRHAAPVRAALGVPTIFNVLGPLSNPAGVTRQVVGVGDPSVAEKMLGVLEALGTAHAMVCYGNDGLDELSTVTTSTVHESWLAEDGTRHRRTYELDPTSFGIARTTREELVGGSAAHNAARLRAVLAGERGPQRDIVCLNAAAALVIADIAEDVAHGLELSASSVDSGAALAVLDRLVARSKELAG